MRRPGRPTRRAGTGGAGRPRSRRGPGERSAGGRPVRSGQQAPRVPGAELRRSRGGGAAAGLRQRAARGGRRRRGGPGPGQDHRRGRRRRRDRPCGHRERRPAAGRRRRHRRGRGAEPARAAGRDARPGHRAVGVRDPRLPARRGAAAAAGPAGCPAVADLSRLRLAVPRRGRAGERGHRGRAGHHPPAGAAARRPGPVLRDAGRARRHRARRHAGAGHRRLAADGRHRDARRGRERAPGRRRGGPDQPAAGRGDRTGDGQRPAGRRGRARSPGGPRPRLHRGAGRRVRRLYARGGGSAERPAAAATGRIGGHPAADRARGAPARGRHVVALLERPGGWRPAAPVRLERGPGAANGGAVCATGPRAVIRSPARRRHRQRDWPARSGPASADHFARKLCGFDPVRNVACVWAGSVDGATMVLPVGPVCTAMWVAPWFSS